MARFPLWGRKRPGDQGAVVGKKEPPLWIQRLAGWLGCCWQDWELSCCWQDGDAVARPVAVGTAGFVPPWQGCSRAIASSNRDAPRAIAARCPGTPAGTPDRWRPSADGNRYGVAADSRDRCRQPDQAETWKAEMTSGNSGKPVLP